MPVRKVGNGTPKSPSGKVWMVEQVALHHAKDGTTKSVANHPIKGRVKEKKK